MKYSYKVIGVIEGDEFEFGVVAPYIKNALMQAESMINKIKEWENETYGPDAKTSIIGIVMSNDKDTEYYQCNDNFSYTMCSVESFAMRVLQHKPFELETE